MKKIALLFLLVFYQLSLACLNYSVVGTDVHGKKKNIHAMEKMFGIRINEFNITEIKERAKSDLEYYQKTKDLDSYLNYATSLVYLGEYDKAIDIFKEIEKIQPNKYELASNLGTAYELKGDNSNALKWIKKALQLNKDSHHGSEWIHVKILAKKIGIIKSDNILDIDFGNENIPVSKYSKDKIEDLVYDLSYQLSERTQFVKPKDPIVGRLFFDLGNALSIAFDLESAMEAYSLSKQYGFSSTVLDNRVKYFENLIKNNKESGKHVQEGEIQEPQLKTENTKSTNSKTLDFKNIDNINEPKKQFPFIPIILAIFIFIGAFFIIKKIKK